MFFAYFLSLFALLFFPALPICPFAPFLALLILRKPLYQAIWLAALAGLTLDLLSSNLHFGLYSLIFALSSIALYKLKNLVFEERPHSLALLSAIASFFLSTLEITLLSFSPHPPPFTGKVVITDLILLPLFDGLLAFFWFCLPLKLYSLLKTGKLTRLLRKERW